MDKEYKVVNGTSYDVRTPDDLVAVLEKVRRKRVRVALIYGDALTGYAWHDHPDRGTIGRSMGPVKAPLLIKTSRSLGGEAILDHCLLEVRESKGGKVLYSRKV
jgi:hypothetical protein